LIGLLDISTIETHSPVNPYSKTNVKTISHMAIREILMSRCVERIYSWTIYSKTTRSVMKRGH